MYEPDEDMYEAENEQKSDMNYDSGDEINVRIFFVIDGPLT